jgi:hypothetical protein
MDNYVVNINIHVVCANIYMASTVVQGVVGEVPMSIVGWPTSAELADTTEHCSNLPIKPFSRISSFSVNMPDPCTGMLARSVTSTISAELQSIWSSSYTATVLFPFFLVSAREARGMRRFEHSASRSELDAFSLHIPFLVGV